MTGYADPPNDVSFLSPIEPAGDSVRPKDVPMCFSLIQHQSSKACHRPFDFAPIQRKAQLKCFLYNWKKMLL